MTLFLALASLVALGGEFYAASASASAAGPGAGSAAGKLNVHLVCHTHDDAGWLKTVDQYYYGANNTIAHAGVQYILDSVISALYDDPSRKFVYAEQAFMWRWWRHQDDETKAVVRRLVANGQLSFINGGWVMHDEATAHYVGMVDQTHLGHSFIRREFGEDYLPKVAWQIDPFGHSATQASLLGAQAGFEALYFGRIDYQDRAKRIAQSDMEMVWRASRSLEERAQIFTGVFHSGNYGPPIGFCFDQACQDEPMMDDNSLMADYNVGRRAADFADACEELGRHTRGDDVMLQMGGDFGFENANAWFKNLDLLMKAVNLEGRVNVFYSTPDQYTRAKYASGLQWGVKKDDFFPYADCPNCYWTGFYSSRPGLKRLERVTSSYLQAARQLHALTAARGRSETSKDWQALAALERAQALVQHHDGVSGTSKQHVAEDYAQRLDRARVEAEALVSAALSSLAFGNGNGAGAVEIVGGRGDPTRLPVLTQCRLSNVSICDVTTTTNGFVAVAYNTLAHQRTGFLNIPVSSPNVTRVTGSDGRRVEWQVTRFLQANNAQHSSKFDRPEMEVEKRAGEGHQGPYTLVIEVAAQPLGIQVLHVVLNGLYSTLDSPEASDDRGRQLPGEIEAEVEGLEARQTTKPRVPVAALSESSVGGDRTAALELRTRRSKDRLPERAGVHVEDGSSSRSLGERGAATRSLSDTEGSGPDSLRSSLDSVKEDFSISNGLVSLTFDGNTGRLSRVEVGGAQTAALDVAQGWFYYPTFSSKRRDVDNGTASTGAPSERVSGEKPGSGRESVMLHQELTERLESSQRQEGGAYILRPERSNEKARPVGSNREEEGAHDDGLALKAWKVVANGPLVWEVHQVFSDWVTQTIRLRRGETHAELDWSVGPVPVGGKPTTDAATGNGGNGETYGDDAGKEVVSRFTASSLDNEGVFHTDANGREFQRRERNRRPTWELNGTQPVAGNFYPVTAAAFIRAEGKGDDGIQLSVLTDRAQGCASLEDGQLEFLAHRRLLTEDQRGVGEALNETDGSMSHFPDWERKGKGEIFRGTHYLVVSYKEKAMKKVRALMDEVFSPLVVAFAAEEGKNTGKVRPTVVDIDEASPGENIADGNGNVHRSTTDRFLATVETATNAVPRRALTTEEVPLGLVQGLAENVALMTLAKEHNGDGEDGLSIEGVDTGYDGRADDHLTLLVRFAHRFALGEDPILSKPAAVDLSSFIRGHSLLSVEEIALTGGASLANRSQQLNWSTAEHEGRGRREEQRLGENAGDSENLARKEEGMLQSKILEAAFFVAEEGDFEEDGGGLRPEFHVASRSGEVRRAKVHRSSRVEVVIGPMEIKTFRLEYVRQHLV